MYVTWAKKLEASSERRKEAIADLRTYFLGKGRSAPYTGAHFESLGGGGDRPEVANVVTADDLIALSLLSVPVNGEAALYLLERKSREIGDLLAQLPTDNDLAELGPEDLGAAWPARELWRVVRGASDFGRVRTSKLLARKRPRLIPITDQGIETILGSDDNRWRSLNEALNTPVDGATTLQQLLLQLRTESEIPPHISALRVLDVVAWMEWQRSMHATESEPVESTDQEPVEAP